MLQPCFLALERDAVEAGPESLIWRAPSAEVALSLREALGVAGPHNSWPTEHVLVRVSPPVEECSADGPPDWMLAAWLSPSEKRCLDLIGDWPWLRLDHLAALLGVSRTRLRGLLRRSGQWGLIVRTKVAGQARLTLSHRGLALLARRDRASIGELRKRWSSEVIDPEAGFDWRNLRGFRTRQLLRNLTHTDSVHGFLAAIAEQAREKGWDLIQLDPPQRASRYFRFEGQLRSIQPDAFGILYHEVRDQPFFLEWERRAVRPSTMAKRLAPYLRYYSSKRPVEDHDVRPLVLVALENSLAVDHFLRIARVLQRRTGIVVPTQVSDRGAMAKRGPLGPVWRPVWPPDSGNCIRLNALRPSKGEASTFPTTAIPAERERGTIHASSAS
ncbi:MAG: hypothetical protein F4173_07975 [Acidobacteriia bacterium]|nr:hypothetical protein [Terriglobia bacterium]